jgi:hypothetical protein
MAFARTILLMWRLRLAYFFGADPDQLARIYYRNEPTYLFPHARC